MPAKEAFRCFRGFRCFRDSVGGPWNRDFVDFVEIVLFVGYRGIVISLVSLKSWVSGGTVKPLKSLKPLVSFAVIPSFYRLSLRWAFCRSAGPEGEGGGFDSPSLPPLDTLPSPKRPGDVPLDPKAEGRSGRLAEKALYCASEVLRIAFSGRHPPCAPIVYARPSGAPHSNVRDGAV